jgi:ribose 5-phosphate isomerase A
VDGADEVDPKLNLIKGLGRALLREKIVEIHARQFVVIVDESKIVPRLGRRGPLPVEIITFEHQAHIRWLNSLGCRAELWLEKDGRPVVTDNGNYLVRCWFPGAGTAAASGIVDIHYLANQLAWRPGIVEHGLFLGMASRVISAGSQGIEVLERNQ